MADDVTFEVLPRQLQAAVRLHEVDLDGVGKFDERAKEIAQKPF